MPDDLPRPPDPPADDPDPPPDEADLVAYLDGELDGAETRAVESKLALDPAARAKAEALKKTYDLLDYLPRTEPSPNFTQRTLTRIDLPPAAAAPAPVTATPVPASPSAPSFPSGFGPPAAGGRFRVAAWAVAGLLAVGGGYAARALLPPAKDAGELAYSDVRVVERLPLYLGVDDLDFLRRLDEAELFPDDPDDTGGTAKPGSPEPVTDAQREKLAALFRAFPPARQQQLRDLDRQLHDLDPPARERLSAVLERYAVWLDRLGDADRKEVLTAPSPAERLDAVRRVKLRAWRAALPASYRTRIEEAATTEERDRLIADFRRQEADRRAGWELARRQWDTFKNQQKPWPFSDEALAARVEEYARTVLRPRLAQAEAAAFDRLRQELAQDPSREGKGIIWFLYGSMLLELSDRHPFLPEPAAGKPVVREADLPKEFLKELQQAARRAGGGARKVLQNLPAGKWPDFAEAVAREAKELKVKLPPEIGPARPADFPPAVREFVTTTLRGKLRHAEWQALEKLEGQWPEYPKKVVELAVAHDLSVPGVTLPGPRSEWVRLYRRQPGRK